MKLRGPLAADNATAKSQSGLNANSSEQKKDNREREDSRTKIEPAETVATVHRHNESGLNEENQVCIFSNIL